MRRRLCAGKRDRAVVKKVLPQSMSKFLYSGDDEERPGGLTRIRQLVFRRLFSLSGDVHVGQSGFSTVRQPITGTQPDVPVPRKMSSSASASSDRLRWARSCDGACVEVVASDESRGCAASRGCADGAIVRRRVSMLQKRLNRSEERTMTIRTIN